MTPLLHTHMSRGYTAGRPCEKMHRQGTDFFCPMGLSKKVKVRTAAVGASHILLVHGTNARAGRRLDHSLTQHFYLFSGFGFGAISPHSIRPGHHDYVLGVLF